MAGRDWITVSDRRLAWSLLAKSTGATGLALDTVTSDDHTVLSSGGFSVNAEEGARDFEPL